MPLQSPLQKANPAKATGTGKTWPATVFAIALGTAGGAVFWRLGLPLPWMMGAMCVTTLAAVSGLPMRLPLNLRSVMVAILGVMLGSAFTPALLDQVGLWSVSLLALVPYLLIASLLCDLYFRRIGGYDQTTAFFAAVPGGLSEMIILGDQRGGDPRTISLAHATRILLVVFTIPFWFRLMYGAGDSTGSAFASQLYLLEMPPAELAILAATALVGGLIGRRLPIPAGVLIVPMVLSAALHLAAVSTVPPPLEIVATAQIILGTAIGCRFAGMAARLVGRAAVLALGALVILLLVAIAFALGLSALTGLDAEALLLAYAPGGLAEMSLIALAQDIDPAFVSAHHITRIGLVVTLAPALFALLERRRRPTATR
ncbi:MAG: AbrB family transcriptional regulator [Alphaproteobacteria bacterium]